MLYNILNIAVIIFSILYYYNKQIDNLIFKIFNFIRKNNSILSYEDEFHLKNEIKNNFDYKKFLYNEFIFAKKEDYEEIGKTNIPLVIKKKIMGFENNNDQNLIIKFDDKSQKVKIYANHRCLSGIDVINMALLSFNCQKYSEIPSHFLKSLPYIPLLIYKYISLKNKPSIEYNNYNKVFKKHTIKNDKNKRIKVFYHVMNELYEMLDLTDEDMVVGITAGFSNISNVKNNVGIMIINFNKKDTIESLNFKFERNKYQFFATNSLINIPFKFNFPNIRNKLDCVITSVPFKTDVDFNFKWFCGTIPIEKIYAGVLSQITEDKVIIHKSYSYGSNIEKQKNE